MQIALTTVAALLLAGFVTHAQPPSPPASEVQGAPAPQQPAVPAAPQQPPLTAPPQPPPVTTIPPVLAPVVTPVPLGARTFTAKTGLLLQAVRPERVLDFETVIGLLQAALQGATDPNVRAQAQGWRIFKATEPGPNGTVLYVFAIDPAVAGADYGLGRILADAYPDRIQEIWKLYTGSLAPSATLLNLMPVQAPPPTLPRTTPAPTQTTPGAPPVAPAGGGSTPPAPIRQPPPQ